MLVLLPFLSVYPQYQTFGKILPGPYEGEIILHLPAGTPTTDFYLNKKFKHDDYVWTCQILKASSPIREDFLKAARNV